MTRILAALLLLCAIPAMAVDRITATITVTNTPADGNTLTVNGDIRTLKTTVATPATQIAITNVVGWQATNIFQQQAAYLYAGPLTLSYSSTNGVKLVANSGNALVVTASGSWCSIVMSTQTVTTLTDVRVPLSGEPTATQRTNIASLLTQGLSDYSTTSIAAASVILSNAVNLSTAQTVTGAKIFSGANVYSNSAQVFSGGTITNSILSNCVPALTNGYATNLRLTNGVNYGLPFRSPGGGAESEQFGFGSSALTDAGLAVGNTALANGTASTALGASTVAASQAVAIGANAVASGVNSIAIGSSAVALGSGSIALGQSAESDIEYGIAIGYLAISAYSNSIAIGAHASPDQAFQIKLGTPLYSTSIPGDLQVDGSISNATFAGNVNIKGTNTISGSLIVASFNNTSLATNNSAVNISTNSYVTIATGPSAAFAIHGIAGGVNGRMVTIENTTGFSMTFVSESGVDATAANRLHLTADYIATGNPGVVTFRYNGTLSRWTMVSHN